MKRILVALEFNNSSEKLVQMAEQIAICFESSLWLVHIAAPDPDFVGYDVGPQYIRDTRAEVLRKEHRELQALSRQLEAKGFSTEPLLLQGATVNTLLSEARKLEIDLIIAGHQRKGFIGQLFEGSVAKELLDEAGIPVLVVPA